MAPFFVYLIKSSVSLALFYIVFRLVMSRDKNHSLNRFLLLGILAASAVIPLLNFQLFKEEVVIQPVSVIRDFIYTPIEFTNVPQTAPIMAAEPVQQGIEINWWLLGYSLAIAALFIRLVISLLRVVQLVRKSEKLPLNKFIIAVIKEMVQPFSFLRYIVISEKDYTENRKAVLAHEQEHIRQLHSIDLLVCEMFTLLHWFNPFMWLLRRDLKMVHEFQADEAVLNTGIDAKKYQLLVVEKAVGERRFALANHFTQKPILKRIKMMKKNKQNRWSPIKLFLFVPLGLLILQAFSKPDFVSDVSNKISPLFTEKDNAEFWLQKWKYSNIDALTTEDLPRNEKAGKLQIGNIPVKEQNVLLVLQDETGRLFIDKQIADFAYLNKTAQNFIQGKAGEFTSPEFIEKEIPLIGKTRVSVGIILFNSQEAAPKNLVNESLMAIGKAYLEVRKEKAKEKFGKDYFALDNEKRKAIDQLVPIRITTDVPKRIGGKTSDLQKPAPPLPPVNIKLDKNGDVYLGEYDYSKKNDEGNYINWGEKVSLQDLESDLLKRKAFYTEYKKKYKVNYDFIVNVGVGVGATGKQISDLKEILKNAKIEHINYSSDFKKSDWSTSWSYENLENVGENILTETGHNPTYGDFKKTKAVSLHNVLLILIDKNNNIRVKGEVVKKEDLKSIISDFIVDGVNYDGEKVSEVTTKDLPHFGTVNVPQGFINFRFDVSASYWAVRETIDHLGEVFLKIKDEKSFQAFNHPYLMLSKNDQSEIDQIVPIRISTGEPMIKDGLVAFADGI